MKLQQSIRDIIRPLKPKRAPALIDYCTVKEAAIILKISQSGVYYRIYREQIPTIKFGRQMLILKSDLL